MAVMHLTTSVTVVRGRGCAEVIVTMVKESNYVEVIVTIEGVKLCCVPVKLGGVKMGAVTRVEEQLNK